jgi:tripartite ATP-independent transporter DctM subunit
LGDILSSAYQQSQLAQGIFNASPVSVGDLFLGAIGPGLLLVAMYIAYLLIIGFLYPQHAPKAELGVRPSARELVVSITPPIVLILLVLGSIISGAATATEAAGVGAVAATVLALGKRQLDWVKLKGITLDTTKITAMVFTILIGASLFSLVFRGLNGEHLIHSFFNDLPGGAFTAMFVVMAVIFILGFILDFIEITFVVIPLVGPVLLGMGIDPIWLGIMIAVNLQTSFLTPPFGFALFYLRGVAPDTIRTAAIYRGVTPFIIIQLLLLVILSFWPSLATWLPTVMSH